MIIEPSIVAPGPVAPSVISPGGDSVVLYQSSWDVIAPIMYDETYYWAPACGRLSNYQGWFLRITSTQHVYCTIGGFGADPGLAVTELASSTGTAVDLTDGNTATQAAADIAAGVGALSNWGGTDSSGATLELDGPGEAVQSAEDWDDRGNDPIGTDERNGLLGMDTHRYDAGSGMVNGPLNTLCTSQHMTVPSGGTRRVYALQVYIGAGWSSSSAERAHWSLYSGTSTTTPVTGSALLYDFGQELTTFSAAGRHTLWVDADTLVEVGTGSQSMERAPRRHTACATLVATASSATGPNRTLLRARRPCLPTRPLRRHQLTPAQLLPGTREYFRLG